VFDVVVEFALFVALLLLLLLAIGLEFVEAVVLLVFDVVEVGLFGWGGVLVGEIVVRGGVDVTIVRFERGVLLAKTNSK